MTQRDKPLPSPLHLDGEVADSPSQPEKTQANPISAEVPSSSVVSAESETASRAPMSSLLSSLRRPLSSSFLKTPESSTSTMSSLLSSLSSSIQPLSSSVSTSAVSLANGVWNYAENYVNSQGWTKNAEGEDMSAKQVEETILILIKELVNPGQHSQYPDLKAIQDILQSCDEGCRRYNLSLSELLQRKSIEGHTPFYWVIVHHSLSFSSIGAGPDEKVNDSKKISVMDMTTSLLKYASPLTQSTISDIFQACLILRDQEFFRQLRILPQFTSSHLSGSDLLLLGPKSLPDDIQVRELEESDGVPIFEVKFKIPQFQKRMMVSQKVQMEFIAMGRLWRAKFFVSEDNANWSLGINTIEQSPPTFVDATLSISQVRFTQASSKSESPPTSDDTNTGSTSIVRVDQKDTLSIKLEIDANKQLVSMTQVETKDNQTHVVYGIVDDGSTSSSSSLQQTRSKYIGEDGSLTGRLDVRLSKPSYTS